MVTGELHFLWQASSNGYNYQVTMFYIGNQYNIVYQLYSNLKSYNLIPNLLVVQVVFLEKR